MKEWSILWNKFVELTPLAVTAEPNSECEYIAQNIFEILKEFVVGPPDMYEWCFNIISDIMIVIISKFRFSELGKTSMKCKYILSF